MIPKNKISTGQIGVKEGESEPRCKDCPAGSFSAYLDTFEPILECSECNSGMSPLLNKFISKSLKIRYQLCPVVNVMYLYSLFSNLVTFLNSFIFQGSTQKQDPRLVQTVNLAPTKMFLVLVPVKYAWPAPSRSWRARLGSNNASLVTSLWTDPVSALPAQSAPLLPSVARMSAQSVHQANIRRIGDRNSAWAVKQAHFLMILELIPAHSAQRLISKIMFSVLI